jgi:phosphatidylserine/phosphatidylglycerophosphate/cardiolipin synthase-like enzyme
LVKSLAREAGEAALLAEVLAAAGPGVPVSLSSVGGSRAAVRVAAADFVSRGWAHATGDGAVAATGAAPPGLASFLHGVAAMVDLRPERGTFRSVVTPPPEPSAFSTALARTGLARADLVETADAMFNVASSARRSLIVLTPFANVSGLAFVADLFRRSAASERVLVIRHRSARGAYAACQSELASLGIDVRDYTVAHDNGYETFHAKVVLADNARAYVGSANMLHYARHSLELGVLLEGRGVEVLAAAVRAIVSCAARLGR